MKKSTIKLIGIILGIVASIIVISGAIKSGYDKWKNKDTESTESAQVQVVDFDMAA